MAAWVSCVLCALVIVKPQEFIPALADVPVLYLAFGLCILSIFIDVLSQRLKLVMAPQLPYVLGFLAWALLPTALRTPHALGESALRLFPIALVFLTIAFANATTRGLRALAVTLVGCALFVTGVAIVQGFQPLECAIAPTEDSAEEGLIPVGHPCETASDCRDDPLLPEGDYRCERPGPFDTMTTGGRVRYRGSLADPNELSLMAVMTIPFAMALVEARRLRRRKGDHRADPTRSPTPRAALGPGGKQAARGAPESFFRRLARALFIAGTTGGIGLMVVMARSRTGLIVFLVVVGSCVLRRYRGPGLLAAGLLAPPMLMFGGRSGAEADGSTEERLELLREGFEMIRQSKGIGVGAFQFTEESSVAHTAHNAYLLAAAEVGIVGACLFGLLLYISLKVPLVIWLRDYEVDSVVSRVAPAVFLSLCGALVGIFFLSWAYKDILYIVIGASAALYGAARAQDARLSVDISAREAALVCGGMFGILGLVKLSLALHIGG